MMRAKAAFRIFTKQATPAFLSSQMHLMPTKAWKKGELINPRRIARETFWTLGSGLSDSATLSDHLLRLIGILNPKCDALPRLQRLGKTDFFCGLFGGREANARFEVVEEVIQWCSQWGVTITLDCYPPNPTSDEVINGADEFDDDSEEGLPRAFAYMAKRGASAIEDSWPNGIRSGDRLPHPDRTAQIVVISDLCEAEGPSEHIARVLALAGSQKVSSIPLGLDLVCSIAGYGTVALKKPALDDLGRIQARLRLQLC
jgi:hypothetical protein